MKKHIALAVVPLAIGAALFVQRTGPAPAIPAETSQTSDTPVERVEETQITVASAEQRPAVQLHNAPTGDIERDAVQTPADAAGVASVLRPLSSVLPSVTAEYSDWRAWQPESITLAAVEGRPIEFEVRSIRSYGDHASIVAEDPSIPGSALIATTIAGGVDLMQVLPGEPEREVHVRGGWATVVTSAADAGCGTLDAEEVSVAVSQEFGAMAADAAGEYTSDVLFIYDSGSLESANKQAPDGDGKTLLVNRARNHVTFGNKVLADSQVTNFTWNVAGIEAAPAFTRDGTLETDLNNLTRTTTELGAFADRRARALGADQVALWVAGEGNYSGIAWLEGYHAVMTWGSGGSTTAHELGHNLGCRHDRREQKAPDGNGDSSYAHRFTYQNDDVGDLMSYAARRYPFFSNAELQVDISKYISGSHSSQVVTIGVAPDQPKAAHAVRTIRAAAPSMASHRTAPAIPVITEQPSGVSVNEKANFTLRVVATGGGLTYQWSKDGAAISGATNASYTKAAALSDAGTYSVTVANSAGSVTSGDVTVAVSAATTGGNSGGSDGGSGAESGGGAFGPWFLAALAALVAVRRRFGAS